MVGVTVHDDVIGHEAARNSGRMSLRRRMRLPRTALDQVFYDRLAKDLVRDMEIRDHGKP